MAKKRQKTGAKVKSRSYKTKKRLAAKRTMLALKKSKKRHKK